MRGAYIQNKKFKGGSSRLHKHTQAALLPHGKQAAHTSKAQRVLTYCKQCRRQPSSREESPHAPCEVHIYRTRNLKGGSSRLHKHTQAALLPHGKQAAHTSKAQRVLTICKQCRRQPSSCEESPHAPCEVHIYRTRNLKGGSSRLHKM